MDQHPNGSARDSDPLADIIKAAGSRTAPPQAHYDEVYAAARSSWRGMLKAKKQRRWYALAASIAVVAIGAALIQTLLTDDAVPAAELAVAEGEVEWLRAGTGTWALTKTGRPASKRM